MPVDVSPDLEPSPCAPQRALDLLFEHAGTLLWQIGGDGRLVRASLSHAQRLGIDPADLHGLPEVPLIHPDDRPVLSRAFTEALAGRGGRLRARLRGPRGNWAWLRLHVLAVGEADAELGALALVDIEGDDELGADLFRVLAQNVPGAVYLCRNNATYSMLFLSDGIQAITGHDAERFLDEDVTLAALRHPDDVAATEEELDRALAERQAFHLNYRLQHTDGSWRWIEEHGQGIYDDGDNLCFLEGALFDASERMRVEQRRRELELRLLRSQKLESLGLLAGGIAHDFNNVLAAIIGSVELAQMLLPPADEQAGDSVLTQVNGFLTEALEAAAHASDLTRQLLAYAGKGQRRRSRVLLSEYVDGMRKLLLNNAGKIARLRIEHGEACELECDTAQLQQIVLNLVLNAAEAIGQRPGEIVVRTGLVTLDEARAAAVSLPEPIEPGRYALLEVEDDGVGMDEATRNRIFDPFFTTKPSGHGLGTSSVLGIVRAHGGGLELDSAPDQGTRFRLLFPIAGAEDEAEAAGPSERALGPGDEPALVLVVDDQPRVRRMIVDALSAYGHTVIEAETGTQALALLAEFADELELAVLDVDMPGIGGVDLFEEIRARRPTLPVLFSSGLDQPEHARSDDPHVDFLPKPYRPQTLAERVGRLLARADHT